MAVELDCLFLFYVPVTPVVRDENGDVDLAGSSQVVALSPELAVIRCLVVTVLSVTDLITRRDRGGNTIRPARTMWIQGRRYRQPEVECKRGIDAFVRYRSRTLVA